MKFSESWIREWVNPTLSTEQLSEQLSMAGLEVDGVEPVAGDFTGVVVGEVVECAQHPDADKLQVTKINIGSDELLDIVCGAPNCRLGIKVAVATVGAILPGNFKIKKAKLRGQPSFGMLCSYSELGMGDDHSGIIELPDNAPVGDDVRDYLKLDDCTIEIDLTPNRADCLGIKGIARELGVLNSLDVTSEQIDEVEGTYDSPITIKLQDSSSCPRYLGRYIKNVDMTATSPLWLTERLRRSGIRSIDPVVDVTNYVLLELGHPMHAFDADKIDHEIVVRQPQIDEQITLLDGNQVDIQPGTLVIADRTKALALAGIFGGLESGVTKNSRHIFLESAFFSPDAILGKARAYGLHTDASHRYERGVDFSLQRQAMDRATRLLLDIVGGEVSHVVEAVAEEKLPTRNTISLRRTRLDRVLGHVLEDSVITEILQRLGFSPEFNGEQWQVVAPSYRFDIAIEEDIIEEVARVYGYNNIPDLAPKSNLTMSFTPEKHVEANAFKSVLLNAGFSEAITYSFIDPKIQSALYPDCDAMVLPNPIASDMSVMRLSILPGLIDALSYNQKRQQQNIRLFETGLVFVPSQDAPQGVRQYPTLAGVMNGNTHAEHWNIGSQPVTFFDIKGVVESLLAISGIKESAEFVRLNDPMFHPGQSANILVDGRCIGRVGSIHPQHQKLLGLSGPVYGFELDLNEINTRQLPTAQVISKFPMNRRDIAVIVDDSQEIGKLLKSIQKIGINELVDINLFDVYHGDGIEAGKKSLALSLFLQSIERTLEDDDIQSAVDNVVDHLEKHFGATLRD